jgi:ATP-GRASP peptide maturase of grasp-with-spasm system
MILILSQSPLEPTTEEVMDWLESFGARSMRLNGEDLDGRAPLVVEVDGGEVEIRIGAEGLVLPLSEVRAVWFRRWLGERRHEDDELLDGSLAGAWKLDHELRRHLALEARKLRDFLFARLAGRPWLSHPGQATPTKLDVLARAARHGLATPATLVTTERDELRRFCRRHGAVITKPIGEVAMFLYAGRRQCLYTALLDEAVVEALPQRFAPSLFQQRLDKRWELRVFYLDGECHAMAIFSQLDPQTRLDFRRYNQQRPNRSVPYRLSETTAAALRRLMADLGLETGSLDLVHTVDGRNVFLEVNPVGQFGMVSKPCNYHLERRLAEHLMRKAENGAGAERPT